MGRSTLSGPYSNMQCKPMYAYLKGSPAISVRSYSVVNAHSTTALKGLSTLMLTPLDWVQKGCNSAVCVPAFILVQISITTTSPTNCHWNSLPNCHGTACLELPWWRDFASSAATCESISLPITVMRRRRAYMCTMCCPGQHFSTLDVPAQAQGPTTRTLQMCFV